jgi:ketosteroid isomerase-like protein
LSGTAILGCMLEELVRRALVSFHSGDLEGLLPLLQPDIHVHSLLTEAERPDYHGYDGVREWFAAVLEVFPDWRPDPHDVRVIGSSAIARLAVSATAIASGVPIEQRYWLGVHERSGRLDFIGFFRDEDAARDALGLGSETDPG